MDNAADVTDQRRCKDVWEEVMEDAVYIEAQNEFKFNGKREGRWK